MLQAYYSNPMEEINYIHNTTEYSGITEYCFHLHNRYEIYYLISGNVNYFIEKSVLRLKQGDLLIMNSNEIHKPSVQPGWSYERIVIHFNPGIASSLSHCGYNLLDCFTNRRPGEKNLIRLNSSQQSEVMTMLLRIENLNMAANGSSVLRLAYFMELLVYINEVYKHSEYTEERSKIPEILVPVLNYIDENLDGDLSLESLERKFYINRYYLSKLFKKSTGSNLHKYIIYKRISKAKILLAAGSSVTEACTGSGFNDYSNFLRMFKRTVGVTPGRYLRYYS